MVKPSQIKLISLIGSSLVQNGIPSSSRIKLKRVMLLWCFSSLN